MSRVKKEPEVDHAELMQDIADKVSQIQEGVKELMKGPLKDSLIIDLIHGAMPYRGLKKAGKRDIADVLAGMASLEKKYLKKPRKK